MRLLLIALFFATLLLFGGNHASSIADTPTPTQTASPLHPVTPLPIPPTPTWHVPHGGVVAPHTLYIPVAKR